MNREEWNKSWDHIQKLKQQCIERLDQITESEVLLLQEEIED